MKTVDIVLIPIANPMIIGIYENNILIDTIKQEAKASDVLSVIFEQLLQKYNIQNILYTNSPGSFLGIKLVYIFLKTLSICKKIKIKAVDGFYFNGNKPIKGIMGKFFIKQDSGDIALVSLENNEIVSNFACTSSIDMSIFNDDIEPIYISSAVY